jgi:23S rRNA pseudouridine1911/1915/1917 synthase
MPIMNDVLFEDNDIIVCVKPVGKDSEGFAKEIGCFPVHRLDKPVGGVMVFAKTKKAAAVLSDAVAKGQVSKKYIAVVCGDLQESGGVLKDFLYHDVRANKTFVVKKERKGVKEAVLKYEKLGSASYKEVVINLVDIELITGRSHQIRVQFGSRKNPLWGDGKYGSRINGEIALFSHCLEFCHPIGGEKMVFNALPCEKDLPWALFAENLPRGN